MRYHRGESQDPHLQEHRDDLVDNGQHPYACVIGCSDSRAAPETVFHARLGELFTIRTAGNVIGEYELGSVEYAVLHLKVPAVLVMGHTHCGAVHAALSGEEAEGPLSGLIDSVKGAIGDETDPRAAEIRNVRHGMGLIEKDPNLRGLVASGGLRVFGAVYDAETGLVEFLDG